MRLHLRTKLAIDDDVRCSETLRDIAARAAKEGARGRAEHVSRFGHAGCNGASGFAVGCFKNPWRMGLTRLVHIDDKRQDLVVHFDQANGLVGGASSGRRNCGNAGADVAHRRQCSGPADTQGMRWRLFSVTTWTARTSA